jgi:hypothetical protein
MSRCIMRPQRTPLHFSGPAYRAPESRRNHPRPARKERSYGESRLNMSQQGDSYVPVTTKYHSSTFQNCGYSYYFMDVAPDDR